MPKSLIASGLSKSPQITPLVIILSFVLLTEVVVMVGIVSTKETPQLLLTWFCVLFPVAIAVPFFSLLALKPWVFYAPRDYGKNIDPEKYIAAMSVRVADKTSRLLKQLPQIIERGALRDADLRRLVSQLPHSAEEPSTEEIVKNLSNSIAQTIRQTESVSVDLAPFGGGEITFPAWRDCAVSDLLDFTFFEISKIYELPPLTYGITWVLEDTRTNSRLLEMGTPWARNNNREFDDRPLSEAGIMPGMTLRAIKLKAA